MGVTRAPSVWTIPFGVPFLDALARGLVGLHGDRLADALVLLPSRRACIALRESFLAANGGGPLLLPRIRPIGDADEDELVLRAELDEDIPRAIDPIRRQLLLSTLVRARDSSTGHDKALRLAGELARLLDACEVEGVGIESLAGLLPEAYAEHWQEIARFLAILREAWPKLLAEEEVLEPARRRNLILTAQARFWAKRPHPGPVVVAGVTGTIPAVARLIEVVARMPRGMVVLPGFDLGTDDAEWDEIGPVHPQAGMKGLLERIGVARDAVRAWPDVARDPALAARERLLRATLRPAATTERWQNEPPPPDEALRGLEIAVAPDLASEAGALALRLREALETPGKTAALVTNDRNLARRVAVELRRFGLEIDDTAGVPLDQTPPAGLLLLGAHAVVERFAPAALLALLKHPLARGGGPQGEFRRYVRALERGLLRGPRPAGGLQGLIELLGLPETAARWRAPVPVEDLATWLAGIAREAQPLLRLASDAEAPLEQLVEAQLAFTEWLASGEEEGERGLWAGPAGEALAGFVERLREAAPGIGSWAVDAWPPLLAVLMTDTAVRPRRPRHPRLAILGRMEARLQRPDLVLVGGLVEGSWPELVESGPWLSRTMRKDVGLPPVEQAIGFAAHDLLQVATAPEVVLSRSRKDEAGSPSTPSRFIARIEAVLRSLDLQKRVAEPGTWQAWAHALDRPRAIRPSPRPAPTPPLRARPRELSVTEIETLIRDPYGLYAKKILGLRKLDPVEADAGGAERGEIIHTVLQRFCERWPGALPENGLAELLGIGAEVFGRFAHLPQVRAIWWPRFVRAAEWFWRQEQSRGDVRIVSECRGEMMLAAPGGAFRLTARADRIELVDGKVVAIVDYKTGTPPSKPELVDGRRPQLALEGAIARFGRYGGSAEHGCDALGRIAIWQVGGAGDGGRAVELGADSAPHELASTTRDRLAELIAYWDDPASAYAAVPRPEIAPNWSDYEHLARLDEWRAGEGGPA